MHLDHQAKRALEISAGAYAMNHAMKGTPIGEEGNPVATGARIGGNVLVGWVLFKFVLVPFLAITALLCFAPALIVSHARHKTLLECFNSGRCTPLSYTSGTTAQKPAEGDDIDKYGYIGTDANGNNIDVYHAVGWVHYKITSSSAPFIVLAIIGGLIWLRFPAWWVIRAIIGYDRWSSGRDLKTGKRPPQVLSPEPIYYEQPLRSKYLAEDGSYVVHRSAPS